MRAAICIGFCASIISGGGTLVLPATEGESAEAGALVSVTPITAARANTCNAVLPVIKSVPQICEPLMLVQDIR